jgi:HK97 family phage prohead protease
MSEAFTRAFVSDIEVRAEAEGRTVSGIVVPFDQVARVSDGGPSYDEAFQRGAFKQALNHMGGNFGRVKLLSQHQSGRNPLGKAVELREDAAGLYGEFQVSKTRAGDEALELVRDGAIDSFSVGFTRQKHVKREHVTWRTEVGIREASLVTFPAYAGATIHGVRFDELSDEERDAFRALLQQAIDLRSTTPDGETETTGTSTEGAPSDEAAEMPLRSVTQLRLAYRRALIERGIGHEQED